MEAQRACEAAVPSQSRHASYSASQYELAIHTQPSLRCSHRTAADCAMEGAAAHARIDAVRSEK